MPSVEGDVGVGVVGSTGVTGPPLSWTGSVARGAAAAESGSLVRAGVGLALEEGANPLLPPTEALEPDGLDADLGTGAGFTVALAAGLSVNAFFKSACGEAFWC
jgi:hypothetical protein